MTDMSGSFRPPPAEDRPLATRRVEAARTILRGDIDGLRAISILAVVAFHAGVPFIAGGFVGVDVFFVISGYLITSHLMKEWDAKSRIDLPAFWARRMRRLMPAFIVVITAILIAAPLLLARSSGEIGSLARAAIAALVLNANHFFMLEAGDYFGAAAETNPLLHMWSLSVEEQYYLIWPLAIGFLIPRIKNRFLWFATIAVGFFVVSAVLSAVDPIVAFFTVPSRAWELLAGALLAALPFTRRAWNAATFNALVVAGVILIGIGCIFTHEAHGFPIPGALSPVAGTVMVIAAGTLHPSGAMTRLLGTPLLSYLGRISYPWYLWHWPLLVFSRSTRLYETNVGMDVLMLAVSLLLAVLTYEFIERPVQNGWLGRIRPLKMIMFGLSVTVFALVVALVLGAWTRYGWGYSEKELALDGIRKDMPPEDCLFSGHLTLESIRESPCNNASGESGSPRILLLGDSHANQWRPALSRSVDEQLASLAVMTMRRCIPLPGSYKDPDCVSFNNQMRRHVGELREGNALAGVVLAARWPEATGIPAPSVMEQVQNQGAWYTDSRANSESERVTLLHDSLDQEVSQFTAMGLKILIVLPSPVLKFTSTHCLALLSEPECGIGLDTMSKYSSAAETVIKTVANNHSNVRLLDPKSFMCRDGYCPVSIGGVVVYSDDDHVTKTFSNLSAKKFDADVAWLLSSQP